MRAFCLTFFICLALVVPGIAGAQTPTDDIYDPVDIRQSEASADAGDLPYTGTDIVLVVLAGAVVLGTGVLIRRATRTD